MHRIDSQMKKQSYVNSKYVTRWREKAANTSIVDKNVFDDAVLLKFENSQFYAPSDYHKYLLSVYGDYAKEKKQNVGLRHNVPEEVFQGKYQYFISE